MRPCVICLFKNSGTSVVVCDKLQKKMHRMHSMHQVGLLSTLLCDSCIAGKSQQFFLTYWWQIICYCEWFRCLNSALLFSHFFFCIIKILIKTYFIIKFITNLRWKYIKIHILRYLFHEQNLCTSYRLFFFFFCTECHLFWIY